MTIGREPGGPTPSSTEVRGEAARLLRRLGVARDRLDVAASPPHRRAVAEEKVDDDEESTPPQRIDGAADEIRTLLAPAQVRLTRLADLARGLADGTLPEETAAAGARDLAAVQPTRRPR